MSKSNAATSFTVATLESIEDAVFGAIRRDVEHTQRQLKAIRGFFAAVEDAVGIDWLLDCQDHEVASMCKARGISAYAAPSSAAWGRIAPVIQQFKAQLDKIAMFEEEEEG